MKKLIIIFLLMPFFGMAQGSTFNNSSVSSVQTNVIKNKAGIWTYTRTGGKIYYVDKDQSIEVPDASGFLAASRSLTLSNGTGITVTGGTQDLSANRTWTIAVSSLGNASIASNANIDATKLGTGIVSNAEFNYLDGLTGSIQAQFSKIQDSLNIKLNTVTAANLYAAKSGANFTGSIGVAGAVNIGNVTLDEMNEPSVKLQIGVIDAPTHLNIVAGASTAGILLSGQTGGEVVNLTGALKYRSISGHKFYDDVNNERFSINANGNVGIGTTSPTYKLEVAGGIRSTGANQLDNSTYVSTQGVMTWSGGTGNTFNLMGLTGKALSLGSNNTYDRFYLATNGNVGIGTISPNSKLEVNQTFRISRNSAAGYQFTQSNDDTKMTLAYYSAPTTLFRDNIITTTYDGNVGIGGVPNQKLEVANAGATSIRINNTAANVWDITNTAPAGTLDFVRGGSNTHMRIDATGNIGIGTSTPNYKLDVAGSIFASGNAAALTGTTGTGIGTSGGYPTIFLRDNGGATDTKTWDMYASGTIMYSRVINDANNTAQVWQQVQRSGATISSISYPNGNVGIGTISPSQKVDVNGTVQATKFKLSALNTAPTSATDTGTTGEIRVTATHIYWCIATNTWIRAAGSTW